jgi:exosome complex exonuclease DIS3/RRP44
VRANGLIVFVPKYGIEGPVYLDDGEAAAAAAEDGGGGRQARKAGGGSAAAAAADGAYLYDEEKQTVRSSDGAVAYTVFDACAVRIAVEEAAGNRRQLVLRLVPRSELPETERMH